MAVIHWIQNGPAAKKSGLQNGKTPSNGVTVMVSSHLAKANAKVKSILGYNYNGIYCSPKIGYETVFQSETGLVFAFAKCEHSLKHIFCCSQKLM